MYVIITFNQYNFFLATLLRILATPKCVATPSLRNTGLEHQIIQQVNQQRARTGYQPFKPSHKFSAKTVQPKEETKNAQK
jgi:hypothetical protein